MSFLNSFKGRFVTVAMIFAVLMLGMAFYTNKLVNDETRTSNNLINDYQSASDALNNMNNHYLRLKSFLYQYSLLLTPELKRATVHTISQLSRLSEQFMSDKVVAFSEEIKTYSRQHDVSLTQLNEAIQRLLVIQDDAQTRYPAVAIMLNELQPVNRYFSEHLDLAINEVVDLGEDDSKPLIDQLLQVRYLWARRISEVRLFIANRSGTFGEIETLLPNNIKSAKVYGESVDVLLSEIKIGTMLKDSDIFKRAIDDLILASAKFNRVFVRTVDAFMADAWRADVYYLENTLEPHLTKSLSLLESVGNALSRQLGQRVQSSLQTSSTVSSYIKWFLLIVYCLIMMAYIAFEKTIRQPLIEVARALDAQGRNVDYEIPLRRYFSAESELLIGAFNGMKEQVNSRQLRLQSILQNAVEGIVITNEKGIVETFNPAAEELFAMAAIEVEGEPVSVLMRDARDISEPDWIELWVRPSGEAKDSPEIRMRHENADRYLKVKTSRMIHHSEIYNISLVADITSQKAFTDRLQNLADMDSLTGLYNRRYFTEELERVVGRANRSHRQDCALLFIDLDNFKMVNDTYGHNAGDKVLVEVARVLQGHVRKGDLLARLGGDEFAVILYDIDEQRAHAVGQKYRTLITEFSFYEQGKVLDIGCTIGLSMLDDSVDGKDDFIMRSDFACQMAKQLGRNRVYVYSEDDSRDKERLRGQMGMAQKIKEAIRHDGFRLVFQPIKTAEADETFCYEVLIRMESEDGQLLMPFGFLPSAERFNLMKDIDIWVIRHAIRKMAEFTHQYPELRFTINLSAQSIGDFEIVEIIEKALQNYHVSASHLIFEITESNAISDMDKASQFLQYLRQLGCKTALDDFGAGYSSYAYLKDLPADYVKIDGAFVKDMDQNEFNYAMVKSMNEIAHIMGKQTIAEFVENVEVLKLLQKIGVDYVQGYYLGRPGEKLDEKLSSTVIPLRS